MNRLQLPFPALWIAVPASVSCGENHAASALLNNMEHPIREHPGLALQAIILLAALLGFSLLCLVLRNRKKTVPDKATVEEDRFRTLSDAYARELEDLQAEHACFYQDLFNKMGAFCEAFLLADNNPVLRDSAYRKARSAILAAVKGDNDGFCYLEHILNHIYKGIMVRFREDFPDLCEGDIRFVSYVFAGFDATTIIILSDMPSRGSAYVKKARLKRLIQKSNSGRKEDYLRFFA